ncbi:MAG: hypothetical protein ACOVMP_05285 [Chthoniobacterales bacterium]
MNFKNACAMLKCQGPGQLEDPDRTTRAALKVIAKSTDFSAALENQKTLDAIAAAKISVQVPEDLLASMHELSEKLAEPVARSSATVKNPAFLMVALAFLAMVGMGVWLAVSQTDRFPGMDEAILLAEAGDVSQPSQFEPLSATAGSLSDWFAMQGFDGFQVPEAFANHSVVGVRVFDFEGISVAMAVVPENRSFFYVFPSRQLGIAPGESGSWRIIEYGPESAKRVMGISQIGDFAL